MPRTRRSKAYVPSRGRLAGRRFRTRGQYRKALAATRPTAKGAIRAVRTSKQLDALSEIEYDKREDALEVLRLMRREGLTLRKAVRQVKNEMPGSRVTERAVLKYAKPALTKHRGKWMAKKSDRLIRRLKFLTPQGIEVIDVKDSRIASELGEYWNALGSYAKGDSSALRRFRGRSVTVGGRTFKYLTSPRKLDELMEYGETHIDSLYERARSAG